MINNRWVRILIGIALVALAAFTVRAILNTTALVAEDPGTQNQAANPAQPEASSEETSSGRSPLDLVRGINLTITPHDFAVDSGGNLYAVEVGSPFIYKFDSFGAEVASWGGEGSGKGQFISKPPPDGPQLGWGFVTVDENDRVYVSDTWNNRVQIFDSSGGFLDEWISLGEGGDPFDIPGPISSDHNGSIYVADFVGVHQFDLDGNFVRSLDAAGEVGVNSQGNLFASFMFQNTLLKMDADGELITSWGGEGSTEDGLFHLPYLVEVDSQDVVYVADQAGRLQMFDSEGNFLGKFVIAGGYELQAMVPVIVAIDVNDTLYVGAKDRSLVYVLRSLGDSKETESYPEGSIAAVLEADGRFTTLLDLSAHLYGASLGPWPLLQSPDRQRTLFAPTDEAFNGMPAELLDTLFEQEALAMEFLGHHMLDQPLASKDFGLLDSWPTYTTLIQVKIESDDQGITYDGVPVLETDIEASNGIIHVVDAVAGLEFLQD